MPLTTGEFLYPTDKSVTDIAGMAYLSKKTALEVRPRMLYLQGRLLRKATNHLQPTEMLQPLVHWVVKHAMPPVGHPGVHRNFEVI